MSDAVYQCARRLVRFRPLGVMQQRSSLAFVCLPKHSFDLSRYLLPTACNCLRASMLAFRLNRTLARTLLQPGPRRLSCVGESMDDFGISRVCFSCRRSVAATCIPVMAKSISAGCTSCHRTGLPGISGRCQVRPRDDCNLVDLKNRRQRDGVMVLCG